MTARHSDSHETIGNRRGPRYRTLRENPVVDSDSLAEFRQHTAGLSNRLPLRSLEAMRCGSVVNPHSLMRRYLLSARSIGLSRAWAQRLIVWLTHTVDSLWPMEGTPTPQLEYRAMVAENTDNLAELSLHTKPCREAMQIRRDTLAREIAEDEILLARYDRELEDAK